MGAVRAGRSDLARLLLRHRADPNGQDVKGVSALHIAAFDGNLDLMRLLFAARANVDVHDRHGQTPVFFVPSRGVCRLLLEKRASISLLNRNGQSALHLAGRAGLSDVLAWLTARVSKPLVYLCDVHGSTARDYLLKATSPTNKPRPNRPPSVTITEPPREEPQRGRRRHKKHASRVDGSAEGSHSDGTHLPAEQDSQDDAEIVKWDRGKVRSFSIVDPHCHSGSEDGDHHPLRRKSSIEYIYDLFDRHADVDNGSDKDLNALRKALSGYRRRRRVTTAISEGDSDESGSSRSSSSDKEGACAPSFPSSPSSQRNSKCPSFSIFDDTEMDRRCSIEDLYEMMFDDMHGGDGDELAPGDAEMAMSRETKLNVTHGTPRDVRTSGVMRQK